MVFRDLKSEEMTFYSPVNILLTHLPVESFYTICLEQNFQSLEFKWGTIEWSIRTTKGTLAWTLTTLSFADYSRDNWSALMDTFYLLRRKFLFCKFRLLSELSILYTDDRTFDEIEQEVIKRYVGLPLDDRRSWIFLSHFRSSYNGFSQASAEPLFLLLRLPFSFMQYLLMWLWCYSSA